jgi:hypothetical protein
MTPKLPGLLVRYIQQGRCVVFVGAGFSAGAGLPTWKQLLLRGIDDLVSSLPEGDGHQKELRELVDQGKLLEVADFCKEKLGAAYHQFLTEQLRGDREALPGTHDALMHLPFSAWVTTNYDKLLERAFAKVKGGFPKTLTHEDTEALGRQLFDGGQFILKAHGDIDRPETVVLTSRDYSRIIHANPAFNEVFSGLLLTKALLFVGYSLADPDFRLLMDRQLTHFKGFIPERYALMAGVGPVERDVLWRTARVQVLPYVNQSGRHAEVLQFLEALKAAVLPAPGGKSGASGAEEAVAGGPSERTGRLVPHAMAGETRSGALGGLVPGTARPSLPLPGLGPAPAAATHLSVGLPQASSPRTAPPAPLQLFIEPAGGSVQLRLARGEASPVAQGISPTKLSEDVWLSLSKAASESPRPHAWLYGHVEKLLGAYLPREVLEALAGPGSSPEAPVVLHLAPELARFPWELLPLQGEPLCLKRSLVRAPIGVSAQVRGAPTVRSPPRILLVEGQGGAGGGGRPELERLAQLYRSTPGCSCTALRGAEATFGRVMAELDKELPDLFHYTGGVGQMDGELYLNLPGDMELSAGALRSVLSRGRLPFLVMSAPSSAFAPYAFGVHPAPEGYQRVPVPNARTAIFEGRAGFMELAARTGVGAFVGAFDMPAPEVGASFMFELHRALVLGLPVAMAVRQARKETRNKFPEDPTPLQYVLSGDGALPLLRPAAEEERE